MLKYQIPHIPTILHPLPDEAYARCEEAFWKLLAYEMSQMISYAAMAQEPQIVINPFRTAGTQYILEFYVNDLAKPKRNEFNFHEQNVSQWCYAGTLLIQNNEVSAHH